MMASVGTGLKYKIVSCSYIFFNIRNRACRWFSSSLFGVFFYKVMLAVEQFS